MGPEHDLQRLLASLEPSRRPGEYVFVTADDVDAQILASVVEDEGRSLVLDRSDAERVGLPFDFVAAWITLTVHSALDAVGLTAAVSTALAEAGISCNVIAGRHHDHLLVPHNDAERALEVLRTLSAAR
jgi:hypothetical protein